MIVRLSHYGEDDYSVSEGITVYADDGQTRMSSAGICTRQSRYCRLLPGIYKEIERFVRTFLKIIIILRRLQ